MGCNVNMIPSAVPTNLERKGTEKEKASPVPSKVRREGYRGRKSFTCTLKKLKRGAMFTNLPFTEVMITDVCRLAIKINQSKRAWCKSHALNLFI